MQTFGMGRLQIFFGIFHPKKKTECRGACARACKGGRWTGRSRRSDPTKYGDNWAANNGLCVCVCACACVCVCVCVCACVCVSACVSLFVCVRAHFFYFGTVVRLHTYKLECISREWQVELSCQIYRYSMDLYGLGIQVACYGATCLHLCVLCACVKRGTSALFSSCG